MLLATAAVFRSVLGRLQYEPAVRDGLHVFAVEHAKDVSDGTRHRSLRGAARKLAHALVVHGIEHDVKEYPGAGHSFLKDHNGDKTPVVFAVMGWLVGARYHESPAQNAQERIVGFFNTHLRGALTDPTQPLADASQVVPTSRQGMD